MWFDGWERMLGGGVPMIPYYEPIIQNHLLDDASLTMYNTGSIGSTSGEVTVNIEIDWVEYSPAVLQFALIEHNLVSDDTYHYVCRDFLPEEVLTITAPGQTFEITRNFNISGAWISQNMDIVTFVQNNANRHVMQSSMGFYYPTGDVTVSLIPSGSPIVIPANGGSFDYNIAATNNETEPWTFVVWCDVILPNATIYGPTLGPVTVTLPAGVTIDRDRTQNVPAGAPSGTYFYNAYVGNYPDDVWDSALFMFEKSIVGDGEMGIGDWFNDGESFSEAPLVTPNEFSLLQNYPNPFNPETTISYALPEASSVTLSVYDVTGRYVTTLIDGARDAGQHEVTWDASGMAAGVYIYHMNAGEFNASGKMVLIK